MLPIQPGVGGERGDGSAHDLGQVERLPVQPDLAGDHALDVEQIIDQMGDVVDLPRDHVVRAGFRLALARASPSSTWTAVLIAPSGLRSSCASSRQELVFRAAVALGTVAVAVGLEQLRHVRHDQVPAIAVRPTWSW